MALKQRPASYWQTVHFLVRFLGITALMTALAGWFVWGVLDAAYAGGIIVVCSAAVIALALVFEVRDVAGLVSSRRGAFGLHVMVQTGLMIALVVGANVFSFSYYQRIDWTRDQIFTLPKEIRTQLQSLRGETDIIVLQQYVSFGQSADNKQDKYDFAAQRKIVEKVKDLAEQFSGLGPRFRVRVLDIQDDRYEEKLKDIEQTSKELAEAIKKAPENSIFFYAHQGKQIQRLSFSDVYQLDKQGSIEGKNLVLKYQGVEPFARKIFNIQEKRPHVAMAVVHPWLGFQNQEMPIFSMAGARKVLDAYGFDSSDLMLRKLDSDGDLTEEATVLSHDESRFEQIEDELTETDESIEQLQKELTELNETYKLWSESTLETLNKKYVYVWLADGRQAVTLRAQLGSLRKAGLLRKDTDVDEDDRKNMTSSSKQNAEVVKHILDNQREEREALLKEKSTLKVENLAEKRRLSDVEAKAKAMLANVDLLVIPRITILNAPAGRAINNRAHRLDIAQINALKAYLKEGKPVLFLLGPTNEPREMPDLAGQSDPLESMLGELGFKLPQQTILYNIEAKEYNQRKFGVMFGKSKREIEVPGLKFDDSTPILLPGKARETFTPHPIRASLRLMNRSLGSKESQEVRVRHPRPVYFVRTSLAAEYAGSVLGSLALPGLSGPSHASSIWLHKAEQKPDDGAVFLVTREESWNEANPFIVKNKVPRYTPPKDDDPKKGTVEEERRGPFPIGTAVETHLPPSWFDKDSEKDPKVRIAVIGSGGAFVGSSLTPLKEKMFLDVANWLMGRDDLLARDIDTWQYPRVPSSRPMTDVEFSLWQWGARLGMPLFFVYLGAIVGLIRRMR